MALPTSSGPAPATSLARRATALPALGPDAEALDAAFARFLRLDVPNGDAARETIRSHRSQVAGWVDWCRENEVDPGTATPDDAKAYRQDLVLEGYAPGTIANKLTVLRRFYEAAVAVGLHQDNVTAGIRPPREKKAAEDLGYLSEVELMLLFRAAPPIKRKGRSAIGLSWRSSACKVCARWRSNAPTATTCRRSTSVCARPRPATTPGAACRSTTCGSADQPPPGLCRDTAKNRK